jgi:uncharacterized membrane protein (UPF0127 family)
LRPLTIVTPLVIAMTSCTHGSNSKPAVAETAVVVLKPGGRTVRVTVELARTPDKQQRGLMYRKQLAARQGMLFIYDEEAQHPFWMKNTYIPLDMIFIGRDRRVVGVVHDAEPMTETSREVDAPSLYILEVNAGFAAKNGIKKGTLVEFEGL